MALHSSLTGCTVYIYDENGLFLFKTTVTAYDGKFREIEIDGDPGLKRGASCKVTVEASPLPWEYRGKITSFGSGPVSIALFGGKRREQEDRQNPRFKASTRTVIESFIDGGSAYALHTPIEVGIVDISQSGVRIVVADDVIAVGVRFEMRLKIGAKDELLIAEAVNSGRVGSASVEYGCSFFGKSEDIKKRVAW